MHLNQRVLICGILHSMHSIMHLFPISIDATIDKSAGCLLGLVVCDALGAATEMNIPGSFEPISGMQDGGVHKLRAGQWTDDSSMAVCTLIIFHIYHE